MYIRCQLLLRNSFLDAPLLETSTEFVSVLIMMTNEHKLIISSKVSQNCSGLSVAHVFDTSIQHDHIQLSDRMLYTEITLARNTTTMSVNLVQSCLKLTEFFESVHQFQNTFSDVF